MVGRERERERGGGRGGGLGLLTQSRDYFKSDTFKMRFINYLNKISCRSGL